MPAFDLKIAPPMTPLVCGRTRDEEWSIRVQIALRARREHRFFCGAGSQRTRDITRKGLHPFAVRPRDLQLESPTSKWHPQVDGEAGHQRRLRHVQVFAQLRSWPIESS